MPFGPFISKEEKARINAAHQSNYGNKGGTTRMPGIGPFVSAEERAQINGDLHRNYGYEPRPVRGRKPESKSQPVSPTAPKSKSQPAAPTAPKSNTPKYKADPTTNPLSWLNKWAQGAVERNATGVTGAGAMMSGQDPTEQVVPGAKPPKPTAPATPAEMPVVTGPNGEVLKPDPNNPGFMLTPDGKSVRGDLTGGKGPISEDTDTGYPTLPNPNKPNPESGGSGGSQSRTSVTGLNQYGKTLGGLNQFTKEFTGGYEIADVSKAFKSEDLPTAYKPGSNTVGYSEDTKYDLPDGATPTTLTRGSVGKDSIIPYTDKPTYDSPVKSVMGSLGGNPADPQDGTSDKPDVADKIRQVRMARNEGVNGADFSNDYGDEDSYVSPMYANEKRNKIRSTFLNSEGLSSVQAIAAANAVAGYGKDSDGNARFNVGGKLVNAKDGMEYKARNAAMMGENPMQYLEAPATEDTKPDQPAASEISPSSMSIGATDTKPDFGEQGGTFPGGGTTIRQDPEKYKETQDFLKEKMGSNFYGN